MADEQTPGVEGQMPGLEDQQQAEQGTTAPDDGEQKPTGLGSGAVSGLGHSLTSDPEPLLDAGTGTDEPGR